MTFLKALFFFDHRLSAADQANSSVAALQASREETAAGLRRGHKIQDASRKEEGLIVKA